MEEVEEANKAAVQSCHRVLNLLSQPQDQVQNRKLAMESREAVIGFKRVVSLLSNSLGHARVRKLKKIQTPFPPSILADNPLCRTNPPSNSGSKGKNSGFLANPCLEFSSNGKAPLLVAQQPATVPYYILQQQQQQQQRRMLLRRQQTKQPAELMCRRSHGSISLHFDNSGCSPTMSSSRSFMSSLSMDGSAGNLDRSAFQIVGAPHSSGQSFFHKRKCAARDDAGAKCPSSSRCHCAKKRLETSNR